MKMVVDIVQTVDGQHVDNIEYLVVLDPESNTTIFHKLNADDEEYLEYHVMHELVRKLGYNPNRCFFSYIYNPKIVIE